MRSTVITVLSLSLLSCGPKVSRKISPDHVGTKYARLTGYFATSEAAPGGRHEEQVPGHLRHEFIRDEATLARLTPGETCFEVMIRTESQYDEPLEQLAPRCEVGDRERDAIVEGETVTVVDYPYRGTEQIVRADAVAASEYLGLSIQRPADKVFRIIGRRATLCCALGGDDDVTLQLENERRTSWDYSYKLAFEWKIR